MPLNSILSITEFGYMGLINLCIMVTGAVLVLLISLRFKTLSDTTTAMHRHMSLTVRCDLFVPSLGISSPRSNVVIGNGK